MKPCLKLIHKYLCIAKNAKKEDFSNHNKPNSEEDG